MRKFIQNKLKDQKGLTLIELLAVIVILAIIAAIAIPAIAGIIENSRVGAIKSDGINVINAADLYVTGGGVGTTVSAIADGDTTDKDSVTVGELKAANYIDDAGSLPDATTVHLERKSVSGTGTLNTTLSIDFVDATKADISKVPNSQPDNTPLLGLTVNRP